MKKLKKLLLICMLGMLVLGLVGCGGNGAGGNSTDGNGAGGNNAGGNDAGDGISLGGGKTINLNDYLTIEVSGYDTLGTATVAFNKEAFKADYADKIKVKVDDNNGSSMDMNLELEYGTDPIEVLQRYCVKYEVSKAKELSNGETINITWNCDSAKAKEYFGYELKGTNIEHKVEGLEVVDIFNPFDYATIEFEGVSPEGELIITVDDSREEMKYLDVRKSVTAETMYKNRYESGETVKIMVNVKDGIDAFVEKFNAIPSPLEMEVTVEGLSRRVTSADEIDEETFELLKQTAEEFYKAEWEKNEGSMEGFQGMTYVGNYFFGGGTNRIHMVYKIDCTYDGQAYPHYNYVTFYEILDDGTGKTSFSQEHYVMSRNKWSPTGDKWSLYFYGYGSIEEMYDKSISLWESSFAIENNIME